MLKKMISSSLALMLVLSSATSFATSETPVTPPVTPTEPAAVTTPVIPPVTPVIPVTPVTPIVTPDPTIKPPVAPVTSQLGQERKLDTQKKALEAELKKLQETAKNNNNKDKTKANDTAKLIQDRAKMIQEMQKKIDALRDQLKDQTEKQNDDKYTDKEMNYIKNIEQALKKAEPELKIIPLDNIITDNKTFEVDAPLAVKGKIVYMPMGVLQKSFGAKVVYEASQKKFIVKTPDGLIEMFLSSNMIEIDGMPVKALAKPVVIKDKVMIPVNQIAKFLKVTVEYDEESNTLIIDDLRIPNGQ